ncbi:MAG: 3-deoxy-8-phosphooctulonate synthase [Planctomycetota bacterium]|nr:3-deoxy-8-phosphooctulonate synthase [Planctomycetota bacterium]MDA1112777.1 3-deoxy-8-phosphooctulonate synthase [Planctomycetota bacterium]
MSTTHEFLPGRHLGADTAPLLLAGPCAIEGEQTIDLALKIQEALDGLDVQWVFKASFDKANRTSTSSGRGIGIQRGLEILAAIKEKLQVPIVTDVHLPEHCAAVGKVADVLQIPAFLCRQTDLLVAAGETGCCVNIKKGQFLAPADMKHAAGKVESTGNKRILITERGTFFGYGRLVVDFSSIPELRVAGYPIVMDATHAVQAPGTLDGKSGGDWERAPLMLRAAAANGFDGYFLETHDDPLSSPSDGPNMIPLEHLRSTLKQALAIRSALKNC